MSYKILIIAPAWVGDLVMAQTLFKLLKHNYSDNLTLDVFAGKFMHSLIARMPEVDNIIENPFQHKELNLLKRIKVGLSLRKNNYNEVIILPNSLKSAITPFFAGNKKRTGFIGESRYILLNNYFKLNKEALPLMIDRFCALANNGKKVNCIEFPNLNTDTANQELLRKKFNLDPKKTLIAFCPAAEYGPAKRWPPEYFAGLAHLLDNTTYQIVILGSKKDTAISEQIIDIYRQMLTPQPNTSNDCDTQTQHYSREAIIDLCGKTDLKDAIDILSLSKYTITNDSGLMHIAASVNSHVIAIYGSTSEEFTPPLNTNAEIVKIKLDCSPCFARTCKFGHYNCLKLITPEMVFSRLLTAQ